MAAASDPEIIVQISDPHVGYDKSAERALSTAVEAIAALAPAPVAVLLTGDLAEHGAPAEYARVRELLAPLAAPVHPLPGNHDDRDALRAAFADHPQLSETGEFLHYAVTCGSTRVVMCDTQDPGRDSGRLCERRLEWLGSQLAPGPAIIAMHHPPISIAMPAVDAIGLPPADRARLAEAVDNGRVEAIVSGHVHRSVFGRVGACRVFISPSVWKQGLLDLRPDAGFGLVDEPPGLALHVRAGEEPLVTHVKPLDDRSGTPD